MRGTTAKESRAMRSLMCMCIGLVPRFWVGGLDLIGYLFDWVLFIGLFCSVCERMSKRAESSRVDSTGEKF